MNRLETDNRPIEFITPDDLHLVNDDYSIYKGSTDKKVDTTYSSIEEGDYEIINEVLKTLEIFGEDLEPEDHLLEEFLAFYKRCELDESTERFKEILKLLDVERIRRLGDQTREKFVSGVRRYKSDVMDIEVDRETLRNRRHGCIDAVKKNGLRTISQVA